jgi:hypothetical protein
VKFGEDRPYAEAGKRKLLELANAMDLDHAGRIQISLLNRQFTQAGGDYTEYAAAMRAAVIEGYLIMHPSGGYVTFTQAGADLFA